LQSKIDVPEGYDAFIFPSPKASRHGLITLAEPLFRDPRLMRGENMAIMLEISARVGSMYFR